jgi:hypothetical protein
MWWRPPSEYGNARRKWYDTRLCRDWLLEGMLARLWVKHFFPTLGLEAANDRDHCRW